MDWVKAFSEVSNSDLAAVEGRIADIKSELAVLSTVRNAMESRLGVKRPPSESSKSHKKKSAAEPAAQVTVTKGPHTTIVPGHRERAAKYLLRAETPVKGPQIAASCSIPIGSLVHVLTHPWFTCTETGYVLTREGQTETRLLG